MDYLSIQVSTRPENAVTAEELEIYADVPRHVQMTETWYEQDDFWHVELTDTTDMDFFTRWVFWAWTLPGGSANYGARWTQADPYSQTGSVPYVHPISHTDFSSGRISKIERSRLAISMQHRIS
jgi:hypothetical protein